MGAALDFVTGQWQRLAIYALLAVILLGAAAGWGYHRGVQRLYDYQVAQAQQAVKVIVKQGEVTTKVITRYVKVQAATEHAAAGVKEEVHRYEARNAGSCLDPEWGRVHDAAATNTLPPPTGGADGPGEAPKAAAALATVTDNYAAHNACVDALEALQGWVREQETVRP